MSTLYRQLAYRFGKYSYEMPDTGPKLGARIRQLREHAGWSQAALAKRVGTSRPTVSQWESGDTKNIKNDNLIALARVFGMSVDALLTGAGPTHLSETAETYRVGAPSPDEEALLAAYRRLAPDDQTRARKIIEALADNQDRQP